MTLRGRDRYWGGLWDIPGGTVEVGETPEKAAVRECLEEVGLSTSVWDLVSHLENLDTHGRDINFHTLTFVLTELGEVEPVVLSHEHQTHCSVGMFGVRQGLLARPRMCPLDSRSECRYLLGRTVR